MIDTWLEKLLHVTRGNIGVRLNLFNNSHTLLFQLKNPQKTGTVVKYNTFNNIFVKVKSDYYAPVTHLIKNPKLFNSLFRHKVRAGKINEYYKSNKYKDISSVHILSENPYLALFHVLAFWPEYDLIKDYFKELPLEKIDKTLWGYHVTMHKMNKWIMPNNLLTVKRSNLFTYYHLILGEDIPLIYKDGMLILWTDQMLKDLSIYKKPTTKEVIKAVVEKLSDPNLSKKDFIGVRKLESLYMYPIIELFPYTFFFTVTPYGLVLNVFKFNFKTTSHDLVYYKPVCKEVNTKVLTNLKVLDKFWFASVGMDDENVYITGRINRKFINQPMYLVVPIPKDKVEYIKMARVGTDVKVNGKTYEFLSAQTNVYSTIIPEKIQLKKL